MLYDILRINLYRSRKKNDSNFFLFKVVVLFPSLYEYLLICMEVKKISISKVDELFACSYEHICTYIDFYGSRTKVLSNNILFQVFVLCI